jgi:Zn-dependent protease with chaperone function
MSYTPDPESTTRRVELEQTVRPHVTQLSSEAGLPEPVIDVVSFLKVHLPTINAHFWEPGGAPTITITERAIQELPHRVLRFLLAHEFGQFAHWHPRDKRPRRLWAALLLSSGVVILGAILLIADKGGWIWPPHDVGGACGPSLLSVGIRCFLPLGRIQGGCFCRPADRRPRSRA